MKLTKLSTLLCLFLFLSACSSEDTSKEEKENNESKTEQNDSGDSDETIEPEYLDGNSSFLYEISGNGLDHPSYLYGTMHMIAKDLFEVGPTLMKALETSDYLVMEIRDLTNIGDLSSVVTDIYLDSGTIKDCVSTEVYENFIAALETYKDIDRETFEKTQANMKPFGLYSIIAQGGESPKEGTKSYELYFMDVAYENSLQLGGLETVKDQLNVFDQIKYEDMLVYLTETLENMEASKSELEELGPVYASHNLDTLAKHIFASDDMLMTDYKDIFLINRNKNWIPKIEELIKDNQCFIAVGAAHLPFNTGVIQLLKNEGYTVRAIKE